MNQTQLVRVDARTARRALKLVRAQLALLPSATMPLALSVPHLTLPALPNASLQSLLAISMAISSSLASTVTSSLSTNPFSISTLRPSLTALSRSLHSLSPSALIFPSLPTIEIDVALLHNLITRLLELAHTRLPRILTRSIPTDPAILKSTVEKLAFTQTRAYAIRYGIQVALSFALRLLPEVERSLPVPLRLTLSLTRLLVRQVVGQVVRVVVGVLVRQVILARKGQVGLGKGAVRIMKAAAKVASSPVTSRGISSPPQTQPGMWIDTQMYPHIMDLTMAHAPYGALVALRAASRSLKARTDVLFVRHVTLTNVEKNRGEDEDYAESEGGPFATFTVSTLHGRHPALLDWPHPGAGGVYAPCGSCIVTNLNGPGDVTCDKCEPDVPWRHTPTSILFKSTRVVDVVGATLMEAVKEFSSLFSALDMMRFQGAWGMDLDMEEKGWVWPKDMTRQTLMCPVRKLVWLGDIGQLSGQRCEAVPEVAGADYVYVFTCSPSLDLEIDFRLEALQSAGSLTVVYRLDNASSPGDVGSTSCAQAHQVEPYTDAVRHEHQPYPPLTVAGFFDLPLDLEPQNGESSAECFLSLARDALRKTARRGEMRDEEVDAVVVERLERVKTVSLDEYSRGLGAEERALILGGGHVVPR